MQKEIWKDIKGYEGLYQISNLGRVKTLKPGYNKIKTNIKTPRKCHDGYYRISLYKNKKIKTYHIHKLVALHFIPNVNNYSCINHKDENKLNNNVNNLEWCTKRYNNIYSINKRKKYKKGVLQYDKNNNFIKEWSSMTEASRKLNISRNSIFRCCNNTQKSAGNFIWKYIN